MWGTANWDITALRTQAGYTFAEISAVLVIVTLIAMVIQRSLSSTQDAERFLSATRVATERGQRTAFELRDVVGASRRILSGDATGTGYLAALDLSRAPRVPGSRLPVIDEMNPMGPDVAGDPRTGNILLFVREADAAEAVAEPATKTVRRIDTYRFVCAYPHRTNRNLVQGTGSAVDLVVWRSAAYPSHAQIMAITDATQRIQVVQDLVNRFGFTQAWSSTAAVGAAFFDLGIDGSVAATPDSSAVIAEDVTVSEGGRFVYANVQLAPTDALSYTRKALFSVDDPGTWTPRGFEVKVTGASGSRKVWIHLVVESPAASTSAVQSNTVIASARDL